MHNRYDFLIVGAGFFGATFARKATDAGKKCLVIDKNNHVAGAAFDKKWDNGIIVGEYGAHIFHTASEEVWQFINQFTTIHNFINKPKVISNNRVYSFPINMMTLHQLWGVITPQEAFKKLQEVRIPCERPRNFEEWALDRVGKELYELFFYGYTKKQWGLDPRDLPASILKRLPLRFNYDDNYYNHQFQGIPKDGYTALISNLLDSKNIEIHLNRHFERIEKNEFDHVFYSGPIDYWFDFAFGKLAYRTLDFETIREEGDFQGTAVMNYCDEHIPFTRITEHKHFSPWEQHGKTVCFREYSRTCENGDIPYYPVRLIKDKEHLASYVQLVKEEKNVTFMGRLGTYRYLDMDVTIAEALDLVKSFLNVYHK